MPDIIEEQLIARVEWCCADPSRNCCEEARAALRAYRELIGQEPPPETGPAGGGA